MLPLFSMTATADPIASTQARRTRSFDLSAFLQPTSRAQHVALWALLLCLFLGCELVLIALTLRVQRDGERSALQATATQAALQIANGLASRMSDDLRSRGATDQPAECTQGSGSAAVIRLVHENVLLGYLCVGASSGKSVSIVEVDPAALLRGLSPDLQQVLDRVELRTARSYLSVVAIPREVAVGGSRALSPTFEFALFDSRNAAPESRNADHASAAAEQWIPFGDGGLMLTARHRPDAAYGAPNLLTTLVVILSVALISVVLLLLQALQKRRHDTRRLRDAEDRLQQTSHMATLGEMASLISHEVSQPLAIISSYAVGSLNLIERTGPLERSPLCERLTSAIQKMARQAERAGEVVRSVQRFVQRREVCRAAWTPEELIAGVMPFLVQQCDAAGVAFSVNGEANLPAVWCDRVMVEQVILNLTRNAIESMVATTPAGDRSLRIELRAVDEGNVEILVADTGAGLPDSMANGLIAPFNSTKNNGMGLGLSLCRSVIEKHGGNLSYRNLRAVGLRAVVMGAEFTFTLPAAVVRLGRPGHGRST